MVKAHISNTCKTQPNVISILLFVMRYCFMKSKWSCLEVLLWHRHYIYALMQKGRRSIASTLELRVLHLIINMIDSSYRCFNFELYITSVISLFECPILGMCLPLQPVNHREYTPCRDSNYKCGCQRTPLIRFGRSNADSRVLDWYR